MFLQMDTQAVEHPAPCETQCIVVERPATPIVAPIVVPTANDAALAAPARLAQRGGVRWGSERSATSQWLERVSTLTVIGMLYVWTLSILTSA